MAAVPGPAPGSWRELAALLRAHRLPRRRDDTVGSMATRLARYLDEQQPGGDERDVRLRDVALLEGPPEALAVLAEHFAPSELRFLSRRVIALAPEQRAAAERALHRAGLSLAEPVQDAASPGRRAPAHSLPPELIAAAGFLERLARLLDWPAQVVPPVIAALAVSDLSPRQARAVRRLGGAWQALLDASLDGEAGTAVAAATPPPAPPADVLPSLLAAIDERRCARLTYRTAARDVRTVRVVEPLALQCRHGEAYLHAYCRWREAPRLFRVSRIEAATLLDERFDRGP